MDSGGIIAVVIGVVVVVAVVIVVAMLAQNGDSQEGLAMLPSNYPYYRRPYYPYYNSLPFWWRIRYGYYPYRRYWSTPLYYRGRPLMWWN